jgi:hypothetical protein
MLILDRGFGMVHVRREADSMPPGIPLWEVSLAVCLRSGYSVVRSSLDSSEETA